MEQLADCLTNDAPRGIELDLQMQLGASIARRRMEGYRAHIWHVRSIET